MSQVSYEEVNLLLRLYDMRREPQIRKARACIGAKEAAHFAHTCGFG